RGDGERVAGVHGGWGGDGEVGDLAGDGDGGRRGRHVRGRNLDRLVAGGDEPDRPGETVRAGVGRGEHVGDAGVGRVERVARRGGRERVAAADVDGAAEAGGDVAVGIDGVDGHRQHRAGSRCGRGGDLEADGAGEVLTVRVVVAHDRDAAGEARVGQVNGAVAVEVAVRAGIELAARGRVGDLRVERPVAL